MKPEERFAKLILDKAKERTSDGSCSEHDDETLEIAFQCGYGNVMRVKYDPAVHGEVNSDCSPGDEIWYWGTPRIIGEDVHLPTLRAHFEDMVNWECECGAKPEAASPSWRWNGRQWEHHHGYPIGHVIAKYEPKETHQASRTPSDS